MKFTHTNRVPLRLRAIVIVLVALLLSVVHPQPASGRAYTVQYDAAVAGMIGAVKQSTLSAYVGRLSGVNAITVGGAPYRIRTRRTTSGVPIQKATQYLYESLTGIGRLDSVKYVSWSLDGYTGRNVVGELKGTTRPNEIILLTAHVDDLPGGSVAPGADDNATGTAAVLLAARILSQYNFERTIRFVFFTGEEQGLLGSWVYARSASNADVNIVAVLNMDMLGWDSKNGPTMRVHTRSGTAGAGDRDIANAFVDVVSVYAISLDPIITSEDMDASDHGSFWARDYDAVCIIEDDGDLHSWGDFNPYYHTTNDTLSKLNLPYFTNMVKAVIGTAAHLAIRTKAP
ncbi:MAG: M20/M25/M40 family metallo-hydrolase [Chloroflexi bacterium]|nr:M20/M25/M40 family metallo-hydrolase [Chloroflexota bacterium]